LSCDVDEALAIPLTCLQGDPQPGPVIAMSAKVIEIDALSVFCDSLAQDLMKPHEKRFQERIRSVKEASVGLSNAASRLAAGVKNAWGTLEKLTSEYGMRLAQTIQEITTELSRKESSPSFEAAEKFHDDAVELMNKIVVTIRKYIPKLHRVLKPEMTALNSSLARLEGSIKALGAALDESPGSKLEDLRRGAQEIVQKHRELVELREKERKENQSLQDISEQEQNLLLEKEKLASTNDFLELRSYEDSLKAKEDEIKQFVQPLTKPLLKLERLASTKESLPMDMGLLRSLVEKPVEAVLTGQLFAITELLEKLEESLVKGEVEFEDRRHRKAMETIGAIRTGSIDRMREEYLAIQANLQETLRQLKGKGLVDQMEKLDQRLVETRSRKEETSNRQKELRRKVDDLARAVTKRKVSVELLISKVARQSVTVRAG